MKKLYLHIGAANTGADILQRNLYRNRKSLMQAGIYYPSEPYGMESSSSIHGNSIALEKVIFSESYDERRLMALLGDYFRASRGRDILFSGEKLEKLPVNAAKDLKHIANSYNFEVYIVYYVRAFQPDSCSRYTYCGFQFFVVPEGPGPPVVIKDFHVAAECVRAAPDPVNFDTIHAVMAAQPEVQLHTVVTLVPAPTVHLVHLRQVPSGYVHLGSHAIPVRLDANQPKLDPVIPRR